MTKAQTKGNSFYPDMKDNQFVHMFTVDVIDSEQMEDTDLRNKVNGFFKPVLRPWDCYSSHDVLYSKDAFDDLPWDEITFDGQVTVSNVSSKTFSKSNNGSMQYCRLLDHHDAEKAWKEITSWEVM